MKFHSEILKQFPVKGERKKENFLSARKIPEKTFRMQNFFCWITFEYLKYFKIVRI